MNCLVIAATAKEIAPFLAHYRHSRKQGDIDIMITGVGLTTATYSLTRQVLLKRPGLIIQAGIAGCFDRNIPLGSVVVVAKEFIGDMVVREEDRYKTVFDLGLVKAGQRPFTREALKNPHANLLKKIRLKKVNAISINQVTTGRTLMGWYLEKYKPVTESMEGAALHYVALAENIPFIQLRGISNYVGERNKAKWNFADSIGNLNTELTRITDNLQHLYP